MIRATCGIVGLANVGKSAMFNALSQMSLAQSKNFPFCTIEPNVCKVQVPDEKLDRLARLAGSEKTLYQSLELHDIAGLIKNASEGAGLGNKFLGNIRSVNMVIHLLRCFGDENIIHVSSQVDPVEDLQVVETELLLADLNSIEKMLQKKKRPQEELDLLKDVRDCLAAGQPARVVLGDEHKPKSFKKELAETILLSSKPILYVCNIDESSVHAGRNSYSDKVTEYLKDIGQDPPICLSARLEEELLTTEFESAEEKTEYLAEYGLNENNTGINHISAACAKQLGLDVYYTVGPQEARAWSIPKGCTAASAAGVIHSDFERGFICADTISYSDFIAAGSEKQAKAEGKCRQEGRDYVVQTGDVLNFKFNV